MSSSSITMAQRGRETEDVLEKEKGNKLVALEERVGGIFDLVANSLSQNGTPPQNNPRYFVRDRPTKLTLATTYCVHGCRVISSVCRTAHLGGKGNIFSFVSQTHLESPWSLVLSTP